MNINYLKTYIEVVKLGSLTKAAKKLYMCQPAVTRQIKKLEKELGCQLIERDRGKFAVTPAGKRLFKGSEYICEEYQYLITDIARLHQGISGTLSLISSSIIGEFVLPSVANEFKQKNPSINIAITIADSYDIIRKIDNGEYLFGFCGKLPRRDGIEAIKIGEDNLVLIVYSGHPFALRNEITVPDLIGETFIIRAEPTAVKRTYKDSLAILGLDLKKYHPKLVMGSNLGVLSAVEAKIGIGFISNLAIVNSEAAGLIKRINIKNLKIKRNLYCIYRKDDMTSPLTKDFLKFIKAYYSVYS